MDWGIVIEGAKLFGNIWLRMFFILTPFLALTSFLTLTEGSDNAGRRGVARRATAAVAVSAFLIYFFGEPLFRLVGITLDSFRVGAGALLFLSAVRLTQSRPFTAGDRSGAGDPSVVPLAIPIIVGPAVAGTILVLSVECPYVWRKAVGFLAILAAIVCLWGLLRAAARIERRLGPQKLAILTKLTGLMLSAIAAEIIFTGIRNLLRAAP